MMICSLAVASLARNWAWQVRQIASGRPILTSDPNSPAQPADARSLSTMDSYALALLLGGLRGPLVMFLWSSSESQKGQHNLEDFDTKVEWIRLLQPEFDTVHLFEIWNKAYNVSVQMANLPDKYSAILDALDYADEVDRQRPDDINIVYSIGSLFGDKLGASHEAFYYIPRVEEETRAIQPMTRVTLPEASYPSLLAAAHQVGLDQPAGPVFKNELTQRVTVKLPTAIADRLRAEFSSPDIVFRVLPQNRGVGSLALKRDRLDPMLDQAGNVLPALQAPTHPRPADLPPDAPWYDGSKLQFLKPYEPFPYGISPQAIAYDYYKRCQLLQSLAHEMHLQTSDFVIDSRPAIGLKLWGAQEGLEGRRAELRFFGLSDEGEKEDIEQRAPGAHPHVAGDVAVDGDHPDAAAGTAALYHLEMAARLFRDAREEYVNHLRRYPSSRFVFASHIADTIAFENLYAGDHDFLEYVLDPSDAAARLSAIDHYHQARQEIALIILRYFTERVIATAVYPKDPATGQPLLRESIDLIPADQRESLLAAAMAYEDNLVKTRGFFDQYSDDRDEYLRYLYRCVARDSMLGG